MYLSRVSLNAGAEAKKELVNLLQGGVYASHQLLWRLFSEKTERHFLFRQEQGDGYGAAKGEPVFYVLSSEPPEDTSDLFHTQVKPFQPKLRVGDRLGFTLRVNPTVCRQGKRHDVLMDARITWLKTQAAELGVTSDISQRQLKEQVLDKARDQHLENWQSQIFASRYSEALESSVGRMATLDLVLNVVADNALQSWWTSRLPKLGLIADAGDPLQSSGYLQHGLARKSEKARFSSVDLTGQASVVDPEVFTKTLSEGIGRAKAFGCGLMLIRRL